MNALKSLLALSSLSFAFGCGPRVGLNKLIVPVPIEQQSGVIGVAKQRTAQLQHYKLLTKAIITQDRKPTSFRYAILADMPDRLRVEALPLQGFFTLSLLVANGDNVLLLDPAEKKALVAHDPSQLIGRIFHVVATPSELSGIIAGFIPDSVLTESPIVTMDQAGKVWELSSSNGLSRYHVDPQTSEIVAAQLNNYGNQAAALLVEYGAMKDFDGLRLPSTVKLKFPRFEIELTLSPISASSVQPKPELFNVKIPNGYLVKAFKEEE